MYLPFLLTKLGYGLARSEVQVSYANSQCYRNDIRPGVNLNYRGNAENMRNKAL